MGTHELEHATGDERPSQTKSEPDPRASTPVRAWFHDVPKVVKAFVLSPIAGFVFNWFFPGIWETTTQRWLGRGPIEVMVGDDRSALRVGWSVALSSSLPGQERPDPGTDGLEVRNWLLDHGAVDVGYSSIQLAVRGVGRTTTRITGIDVRVLSREPILDATLVSLPSAGASDVIALGFDLDSSQPIARTFDHAMWELGDPYFRDNLVTINPGEIIVFSINGLARQATYTWILDLRYQYDGEDRSLTIDQDGAPFRTTAQASDYDMRFDWAWYEPPAHFLPVNENGLPME